MNDYKTLVLINGQEICCEVVDETETQYKIIRGTQFKLADYTGEGKDMLVPHFWPMNGITLDVIEIEKHNVITITEIHDQALSNFKQFNNIQK